MPRMVAGVSPYLPPQSGNQCQAVKGESAGTIAAQPGHTGGALTCCQTIAATATACRDRQTIMAAVKRPSSSLGRMRMCTVLCRTAGTLHLSSLVRMIQWCPGPAAMPQRSYIASAMLLSCPGTDCAQLHGSALLPRSWLLADRSLETYLSMLPRSHMGTGSTP